MPRVQVPAAARTLVLLEAGYKCANPTCRHILTLEFHHIEWVKDGGDNEPGNLVALCPNCHTLHTAGLIPRLAIETWKSLLVALNSANRGTADLLLVLAADEERFAGSTDATQPPRFRFTGDGLQSLAGLLTAGLAEISQRFSGGGWFGGSMPSFEICLTQRGKDLVASWKAGKPTPNEPVLSEEA